MTPAGGRKDDAGWGWAAFAGLTLVQMWVAHALVLFAHEYAHSFTAWVLGWKANPLALNYAHPTVAVLLVQRGIDQNVDELPIFASGHGMQAAVISGAGMVLGNAVVTLALSLWGAVRARAAGARGWAMLWYWVCVASVGNLIDYVPIRVFTDGTDLYQDMFAVEKGLGWSPWTLLVVFGVPALVVVGYFFARIEPETLRWVFPQETGLATGQRVVIAVLTGLVLFGFYGAAGWWDGGAVAHRMSVWSVCLVAPLVAVGSGVWMGRRKLVTDSVA